MDGNVGLFSRVFGRKEGRTIKKDDISKPVPVRPLPNPNHFMNTRSAAIVTPRQDDKLPYQHVNKSEISYPTPPSHQRDASLTKIDTFIATQPSPPHSPMPESPASFKMPEAQKRGLSAYFKDRPTEALQELQTDDKFKNCTPEVIETIFDIVQKGLKDRNSTQDPIEYMRNLSPLAIKRYVGLAKEILGIKS